MPNRVRTRNLCILSSKTEYGYSKKNEPGTSSSFSWNMVPKCLEDGLSMYVCGNIRPTTKCFGMNTDGEKVNEIKPHTFRSFTYVAVVPRFCELMICKYWLWHWTSL